MADLQRRAKVRIPSHELLLADNSQHMNNTSSTNQSNRQRPVYGDLFKNRKFLRGHIPSFNQRRLHFR